MFVMDKCINIKNQELIDLFNRVDTSEEVDFMKFYARVGIWMENHNTDNFPTLGQLGLLPKEQNFINLSEGKELYKSWGLLNKNGTFKTFNRYSEKDRSFLKDINNRSLYYSFYFRKGPNEKDRILAIKNPIYSKVKKEEPKEEFVRDIKYYNYDYRLMEQEEGSIKYSKELVKEGVDFVFEQNPELSSIGTKQQYSQYLDTIFPDSKVKDIVYHGSKSTLFNEKYIKNEFGRFIFSTKSKEYADTYSKRNKGRTFQVLNNINNPFNVSELLKNKNSPIANRFKEFLKLNKGNGYDLNDYLEADTNSLIDLVPLTNRPFLRKFYEQEGFDSLYGWNEIAVFEPEQIHILGSKQDIEGFKNFISNILVESYKSENPLKSYDSPELIVSMTNLLQEKFGVKINFIHDSQLSEFQDIPNINIARSFVKNGEYFVNIDKANISEPLHEILHMVLASMKYSDFDNYMRLVESVENHPLYQDIVKNYDEINSDVLEETFVTLFSETVRKNILINGVFTEDSFENSVKDAIKQMFDLGVSLERNSAYELMDMEVKNILFDFSSSLLEGREEIYNTDNAVKMMSLSSLYRKLLKDGDLIQKCNG